MTRWMRARLGLCTALGASLALGCATTTSGSEVRDLPVGLSPVGALLTGCTPEADGDVVRARCDGDVLLSLKTRLAGAAEPTFREEAFSLASVSGARLSWDRMVVATEGPTGAVDRARALAPMASAPEATLIGAVRDVGEHRVQEVWCTSRDPSGDARCRELVGAVLGTGLEPKAPSTTAPAAAAPPTPTAPRATGPAHVFGRALSLPTTCSATLAADGGDASCGEGASLSWRKLETMDEAAAQLTATLAALDLTEGEPYPCTLAGELAQCEDHGGAVAGLTYLDGAPVAVACFAPRAREHALCKSLLRPR